MPPDVAQISLLGAKSPLIEHCWDTQYCSNKILQTSYFNNSNLLLTQNRQEFSGSQGELPSKLWNPGGLYHVETPHSFEVNRYREEKTVSPCFCIRVTQVTFAHNLLAKTPLTFF